MQTIFQSSPEQYLNSRPRDYRDLLQEISDTKGNLGYATIVNATTLSLSGVNQEFSSNAELKAFILR